MNKPVDYQILYEELDPTEKGRYLALVESTRIAVHGALVDSLSHEDIRQGVRDLRGAMSSLVSELMGYIALNDTVGFSSNPGTDLRHSIAGLARGLDGCIFMIEKKKMIVDNPDGVGKMITVSSDDTITEEIKKILRKREEKFSR